MSARNTDTTQLLRARAVVEAREQGLAAELRELANQHQGAEQTLTRLNEYLDEYAGADRQRGGELRSPLQMVNGRRFARRLGGAIDQQQVQAQRIGELAERKLAQWQRARADLAAIDRLIDTRRRSALQDAARREQRETDARASRPRETIAIPADPEPRPSAPSTIRVEPRT